MLKVLEGKIIRALFGGQSQQKGSYKNKIVM
jgi:hypothetical protein